MNGPHDLGGKHGFGPVVVEADEPHFHATWESRVLAITLACGYLGQWNIDQSRFERESIPPAQYLSSSYYQIWLIALEKLLARRGLLDPDQRPDGLTALTWPQLQAKIAAGGSMERPTQAHAAFAIGDQVRTRVMAPRTHTRLPEYARGKPGTVVAVRGAHVFPDARVAWTPGDGPEPVEWLYTVELSGPDVWGADADPRSSVLVDAFEPYLEPTS